MANKIQFKRGLKVSLPTLSEAEPGFCTDTKEIFIGSSGGNVGIVNKETFDKHLADRTKNLIINGGLEIWQRGIEFSNIEHFTAVADRFRWGQSQGNAIFNVSRSKDTPNDKTQYSMKIECTGSYQNPAGFTEAHMRYAIEGYDFQRIFGKKTVLGFDVKSSKAGIYTIAVVKSEDVKTFLIEYEINQANTWERKEIVIPFDEEITDGWNFTNGQGCKIRWTLYAGTGFQGQNNIWNNSNLLGTINQVNFADTVGNAFYLANIQLEKGEKATPFVKRDRTTEILLCQRYYEKTYDIDTPIGTSTPLGTFLTSIMAIPTNQDQSFCLGEHPRFKVEKRVVPTVKLFRQEGVEGFCNYLSADIACMSGQVSPNGFRIHNNIGEVFTPENSRFFGHWAADAEL